LREVDLSLGDGAGLLKDRCVSVGAGDLARQPLDALGAFGASGRSYGRPRR
jgi:hypothetical protein